MATHAVAEDKQGALARYFNDATTIFVILSWAYLRKLNVSHLTQSSTDCCN